MSYSKNVHEILGEGQEQHDTSDETQPCYVYKPLLANKRSRRPPSKRRKVSHRSEVLDSKDGALFVPLLEGQEKKEYVDARSDAFRDAWSTEEKRLKDVLEDINAGTVEGIIRFLKNVDPNEYPNQIPTCLITTGPAVMAYGSLFDAIADMLYEDAKELMITLTPSQCPNLKTALKNIIQLGTSRHSTAGDDDDGMILVSHQVTRLLNYDLQILHDYMKQHVFETVVISFQSTEAFESNILAELIDVFKSWKDRVQSVFLFEIAISVDNFQEKMTRVAMRHLRGVTFEASGAEHTMELMFKAITSSDDPRSMWIGPGLSKTLLDRQLEHIQSGHAFIQALKYVYMTHFFANPLTVVWNSSGCVKSLQTEHYEAIRDLPSFRRFIQDLIENDELDKAQSLLEHDKVLQETVSDLLIVGQKSLIDLLRALDVLSIIQSCMSDKSGLKWSELYIKGFSAGLANSNHVRELLLLVRKLPSNVMEDVLEKLPKIADFDFSDISTDLKQMIAKTNTFGPFRSEFDLHHETLRTTVVAQRVELSKHKSALSKQDIAYTKIVNRVDGLLKSFLEKCLINPKDLLFHEIFLFDLKSSCRDAFSPSPRYAVERALSVPHDYLDCECCDVDGGSLSSTQPSTAILYQLYLESGATINISDLWSAFYAIVGPEQGDEGETSEETIMAFFYRGLAELKYLGFIKNSRTKSDHLTKLAWKGL